MKPIHLLLIAALVPLLAAAKSPSPRQPKRAPSPLLAPAPAEWTDDTFDADVYPSQRAAAQHVGQKWAQQLEVAAEPPKVIRVFAEHEISPAAREALKSALQARLPQSECRLEADSSGTLPPRVAGEIVVNLLDRPLGRTTPDGRRTLCLEEAGQGTLLASAAYVDKPWADEALAGNDPALQDQFLIVRSMKPAASAGEAFQQAVANASSQLVQRIRGEIMRNRPSYASVDQQWLIQKIGHDIQQGRMIRDRFIQKFDRPYGAVYREALLVNIAPENLGQLVGQAQSGMQSRLEASRHGFLSIVGLFLVIYLLYLLLNAVTKGYFRWSLRATAVVLALAGVLAVMMLA